MDRYQYKPLSSSGKQIRLVVVHPRVPSRPEEIRVTIFETPLEAEHRVWPTFMALSYVWGDTNDRRDLTVVDLKDEPGSDHLASPKCLSVTANLVEALTHRPWPDKHCILWIDAICINQEDLDERSEQVKLMAEIYSSASQVHAWLGPPTHDSNLAMNLLHRISDSIDVDWTSFEIRTKDSQWSRESTSAHMYFQLLLDLHFNLPWDGPESQALESLLNRPWFERLWIRQEVTLGADRAVLICGSASLHWSAFRKAAVFLNKKSMDPNHPRFERWRARIALVADSCIHSKTWLGQLLRQMQRTACTDPRDRVYGILGILPPEWKGLAAKIRPDYRKPVVWVYQELLLAEMTVTGRADLLSECLMPKASTTPPWSPSWVPNWTVRREWDLTMTQQCADGQSAVAAFCPPTDQGTLRIKGVLVATIVDTLEFPSLIVDTKENRNDNVAEQPLPLPPVVALIKEVAAKLDLSDTAHYRPSRGSTVLEALCYAFSGGGHLTDHLSDEVINNHTPSMAQFKRLVEFALEYNHDDASALERYAHFRADVLICTGHMVPACKERALLITREGYVGAGPAAAQPGDKIAVMPGCMRPLVLRPQKRLGDLTTTSDTEYDTNTYTVVGPCNAHGLNWGEALLGPLPDDMTFIWSPSRSSGDVGPEFRNSHTGEETVADPRIDWDLLKTDSKERSFVQREATVAEFIFGADEVTYYRRPDAEYFERKGVALRNLDFV
ncbi:uncharacterized protein PAC_15629 [Phialocephala subalpina]|uniref:Heterokaryon incompatibility domain-containing protein n=1 Tax=Phialocephala subalpina TaxID=576137 RepID=A0A1L7XL12_9HELO|nr:uncharacterized protein PAC_15629 [Phialocephala subalpina]